MGAVRGPVFSLLWGWNASQLVPSGKPNECHADWDGDWGNQQFSYCLLAVLPCGVIFPFCFSRCSLWIAGGGGNYVDLLLMFKGSVWVAHCKLAQRKLLNLLNFWSGFKPENNTPQKKKGRKSKFQAQIQEGAGIRVNQLWPAQLNLLKTTHT